MQPKFQAGDWVECINADGVSAKEAGMERGKIYEVVGVRDQKPPALSIKGVPDHRTIKGWFLHRFKRVDRPRAIDPLAQDLINEYIAG